MRRDEEVPIQGIRSISGEITGSISALEAAQVSPESYIDIDLAYSAFNPNEGRWKIFVVAQDSKGNKELVKDADVQGPDFEDEGSWRLWKMPAETINLEVRLYAHDEIVAWTWAWWPEPVA